MAGQLNTALVGAIIWSTAAVINRLNNENIILNRVSINSRTLSLYRPALTLAAYDTAANLRKSDKKCARININKNLRNSFRISLG